MRALFEGAAALIFAIVFTTARLMSLKRQVNTWVGASPPADMPATRALWLRWHLIRTIAALVVFALTASAVVW